jgi:hypothetical protein
MSAASSCLPVCLPACLPAYLPACLINKKKYKQQNTCTFTVKANQNKNPNTCTFTVKEKTKKKSVQTNGILNLIFIPFAQFREMT